MPIPILVVDANREFAILIRQALEEGDRFEVSLASSAEDALALAKDQDFDLAIIDFALPDLEAQSVVERLRALQPGLAIIAIPLSDSPDPTAFRRAGVDGILTKPFYLPNLPNIVEAALSGRLDTGRLRSPPPRPAVPIPEPAEPPQPEPVEPAAPDLPVAEPAELPPGVEPPWLSDVDRAARYLTRLTLESSAEAAMLIRGQHLIASAGQLPRAQLLELTSEVAESWADEGRSGAVARFVRLPGTAQDFMLYATGFAADLVLSLVFSAETPFGMIRRQAEDLAHALWQVDPLNPAPGPRSARPRHSLSSEDFESEQPPASGPDASRPAPEEAPIHVAAELPADWIPEPGEGGAGERLLAELAQHQPVVTQTLAPAPSAAAGELPLDWLPVITHSARHVPYLEEAPQPTPAQPIKAAAPAAYSVRPEPQSAQPEASPPAGKAPQVPPPPPVAAEPDSRLSYGMVFAPRFPEHRLSGGLVESLPEWTRRLCVAWDWKAERIALTEDTLVLEVRLPPDQAPAEAADRLAHQLSERILETYPHLNPGFPAGNFWATAHLLRSGGSPSPSAILGFVRQLRTTQGYQT